MELSSQTNIIAKPMCGLVIPLSDGNGYTVEHWQEVRSIIEECLEEKGFDSRVVSEGQEIGIIHGRIVENLYNDPLVICDVSSRNPNVMFELGMRITFDKPVIILKDDEPSRIFDTDIIEFISYPKDLKYSSIVKFKEFLKEKISATYEAGRSGEYSVFLKHFKDIKPTKLQEKEMGFEDIINKRFDDLYSLIARKQEPNKIEIPNATTIETQKIYDKGLTFVRNYLNENISVQEKFILNEMEDNSNMLFTEATNNPIFLGFTKSEIRTALVYGITYMQSVLKNR